MNIDAPKPDQIPALRALWEEAFGDTEEYLEDFFTTAFAPERCRCIEIDEKIVAALYWFDCSCNGQRIAYLYAIATAKAYQGRGLCRHLMENTHNHLRALGYASAILVPGTKDLFSFYERGGYIVCGYVGSLLCSAERKAITVRKISPEEYGNRRRNLLPTSGVIQEGENLRFLETQATLYATDTAILAARSDGNTVCGLELLGDPSQASAIIDALGCKTGKFRTPNGNTPFAMYYPLVKDALLPSYFGLAFD